MLTLKKKKRKKTKDMRLFADRAQCLGRIARGKTMFSARVVYADARKAVYIYLVCIAQTFVTLARGLMLKEQKVASLETLYLVYM